MKSESLGEVLLQEQFTVWDPKQLIKKGRERHLFLFEMCLLFSKEIKDSTGKSKYQYKFKLMVSWLAEYINFPTIHSFIHSFMVTYVGRDALVLAVVFMQYSSLSCSIYRLVSVFIDKFQYS